LRLLELLVVSLKLGLTSFGGPVAHIGYFRDEYVVRRKWLDEHTYADLVALCQFLPGPASSQVGIAVGITRGGILGGIAAWVGFTLPSAVALIFFGYGVTEYDELVTGDWLRGLKIVAVAVVALAVWGMAKTLTPDRSRATIAVLAAIAMLFSQNALGQVAVIVVAGLVGWRLLGDQTGLTGLTGGRIKIGRWLAIGSLAAFFVLLVGLPLARQVVASDWLDVFDGFYRSGALMFGGGHVVLPLLQTEVVAPGWVTNDQFIAGYGAAQAVPGPLFTFSAYLGTVMDGSPGGWTGGFFALGAIFLPSFLLVVGVLPFWNSLRSVASFRAALMGVNAAVVGLLIAALYDPVWTSAIQTPKDFALCVAAFGLLAFWKWPPWLVVLLAAAAGAGLSKL
jgi:chromate transporter